MKISEPTTSHLLPFPGLSQQKIGEELKKKRENVLKLFTKMETNIKKCLANKDKP